MWTTVYIAKTLRIDYMKSNNFLNKKILILGSCGFLMSNFVRRMILEKNQISSIDKGHKEDLGSIYVNKSHDFYLANINDLDILDKIFCIEQPDLVIHGAIDRELTDALTKNALEVSSSYDVKRFIYISDSEVYGDPGKGDCEKVSEEASIQTGKDYANHKIANENMVKDSGLHYNIVRLSNIYGPREQSYNLIPGIIRSAVMGKEIEIMGDGSSVREWTHVFDAADGLMTIIRGAAPDEMYNLSSGQEFSTMEVVHTACSSIEKYHGIKCHHLVKYNSTQKNDFEFPLNIVKLKSLDWQPSHKFKNGIDDTVNWYMNNQWKLKI